MNYLFHVLIMICIYLILSLSINLLVGYIGLLSLCHAAFYAIGAYTTAILMVEAGANYYLTLVLGFFLSMLLSLVIAVPSLRLKGDYFLLASLGFQTIMFNILNNWVKLTKGPYGIAGIPKPKFFGTLVNSQVLFFILALLISGVVLLFMNFTYNSPFGRVLKAIREDEILILSLGRNTFLLKISAFVLSAGIASIAGSMYSVYATYIDPTCFTLDESIFILSVILVGGSGNFRGPVIGTIFMILLPELLRFIGIPDTIAPNIRQMIYGAILVILMNKRPEGIAGEYKME